MGVMESKLNKEKDVCLRVKTVPSTPIQCAKSSNLKNVSAELDPRSPSENISRTPIEVPSKPTTPLKFDDMLTIQQVIDPRSPTDQFHRTPILIQDSNNTAKCPKKLHNKLLDNARRSIMYTPTLSTRVNINPVKCMITPPKLLESSPVSRKNLEKRKSFVGVLETNIDYTETNLDDYVKSKSLGSNLTINISDDLFSGSIIEQRNCDPRSPSNEILRTPIEIVKKIGEIDLNVEALEEATETQECGATDSLLKIAEPLKETKEYEEPQDQEKSTCSAEIITCENLNDVGTGTNEIKLNNSIEELDSITNGSNVKLNDSNMQTKDVDMNKSILAKNENESCMEKLCENIEENMENITAQKIFEPTIDLTADVQEFDRKLTKIIHEDDEIIFRESKISMGAVRNRTPMKDRNLIQEPKKNKLKVSDKPRKQDYAVSKIPVFREKGRGKLNYQCENTPPSSLDLKRKKKSQPKWDSDKTLVI